MHDFDRTYWERHWRDAPPRADPDQVGLPNPHVAEHTRDLMPGTALDVGCGVGAEAVWLATLGWEVTGVEISPTALTAARAGAQRASAADRITWVEADASVWEPSPRWDLVMTNYAHPAIDQRDFYARIARWVAPGGRLLIVGHRTGAHAHGRGEQDSAGRPPHEATTTVDSIAARLDPKRWRIETSIERDRRTPDGRRTLFDVVVRATRRPGTAGNPVTR